MVSHVARHCAHCMDAVPNQRRQTELLGKLLRPAYARRTLRILAVGSVLFLLIRTAAAHGAQSSAPDPQVTTVDLSVVTCSEKPLAPRYARSPVLVSPNGQLRAYVEVSASVVERSENDPPFPFCANRSNVFMAGAKSGDYRLVYMEEPTRSMLGNGINPVDWSPDSRYLLLELWRWQYGSDVFSSYLLVYDVKMDLFRDPDLKSIFGKRFRKECWGVDVQGLGFTAGGKIVLAAEDDKTLGTACLEKRSLWLLDPDQVHPQIEPLPDDYKIMRYGTFESDPRRK